MTDYSLASGFEGGAEYCYTTVKGLFIHGHC